MALQRQQESPPSRDGAELRAAARRRVLMRATMRLQGQTDEWSLTVKDLSSTGMKARAPIATLAGLRVEIGLPNIGWVPGEIVRIEGEDGIGIRFGLDIDPAQTQIRVSGSYGCGTVPAAQLRRV